MRINRWVDLLDRMAWTFVQAAAGALLVLGFDDWKAAGAAAAVAGAIAAIKTAAAQQVGGSPLGDAVPGASVVERRP